MFKFHFLAGCRHCTPIFHPHVRKLTMLVENNAALGLESAFPRVNELKNVDKYRRINGTLFLKYLVNESCYVRRNMSSDVKDPSLSNSQPENPWFDLKPKEYIGNKSSSKRKTPNTSKRSKKRLQNNDFFVKNKAMPIDKSFVQDLIGEYETQKSVMFKDTPSTRPAAQDAAPKSPVSSVVTSLDGDDADTFGTVGSVLKEVPVFEEDEKDEEKLVVLPPWNMYERQEEYVKKLQALCKEGNLEGALAMLESEMKEEKVKPTAYHFRILIGACAKLGHADKAFKLFAQLKKRGLAQKPLLFSYLFIACTNARDPGQHLQRITDLRAKMAELQMEPSVMNYNAMLLAFGRCGAVETAFEVFDEMLSKYPVSTRSFNCLMTACVSDREVGFRYAIELWQRMRTMKIKPDVYSFNLLLRCVVECKSGNLDLLLKLFKEMSKSNLSPVNIQNASNKKNNSAKIASGSSAHKLDVVDVLVRELDIPGSEISKTKDYYRELKEFHNSDASFNKPERKNPKDASNVRQTYFGDSFLHTKEGGSNSFSSKLEEGIGGKSDTHSDKFSADLEGDFSASTNTKAPIDGRSIAQMQGVNSIVMDSASEDPVAALINTDEPPQRLMLLGGLSGVLNSMAAQGVRPNMKTFLTLLWALPDTLHCEQELLELMKHVSITPSTAFCNMLIKKRALRGDYALAKSTLSLLSEHRLSPDVITYGCLALGCRTFPDAVELLTEMRKQGGCPNVIIMLNLARNAVVTRQYDYCRKLFNQWQKYRIEPHTMFVELMEEARTQATADLKTLENDDSPEAENERKERKLFIRRYNVWLRTSPSPREKKAEDERYNYPDVSSMLI